MKLAIRVALLASVLSACGGANPRPEDPSDATQTDSVVDVDPGPVSPPSEDQARLFADANNRFAVDLWQRLRESDGNLVVSPASISMAVGMTWAGARGQTAEQMASTMHYGDDAAAYHAAAGRVLSTWNDPSREAYALAVANRLFGEQTYTWQDEFIGLTRDIYRAPLEPSDFIGAPDGARVRINTWVAGRTNDRIRDLTPTGGIDDETRMVLANAVYFQGDWAMPFEANATSPAPFYASGREDSVPTMRQTDGFRYGTADGVQLLEMSYQGGDLAMLIALPTERDGLARVEAGLDHDRLRAWSENLSPRSVAISLPKFRVDPTEPIALRDTLVAMGMRDAFEPDAADFSGIADPSQNEGLPLFISAVFHKAFVAVDEQGTEAAAATAVVMGIESAAMDPVQPVEFRADHPFLFFIRDTHSGAVLFMGRVANPAS